MGALILGYISSKALFVIGLTVLGLAGVAVLLRELHGRKWATPGYGRNYPGGTSGHMEQQNIAMAAAMDALGADTDPESIRRRVLTTIANNSIDNNQTQSNVDQITRDISGDQQPGGPIAELIQERRNGTITPQDFQQKIMEYVRQKAQQHGVPLREDRLINTVPFQLRQMQFATRNMDMVDKIKFINQSQGQGGGGFTPSMLPPFPAFPHTQFPTLPANTPPSEAATLQASYNQRIEAAQDLYNRAQQRYDQALMPFT